MNASTSYIDTSVKGGATYYYVSTAVAGSGVESKFSNQLRAAIPSP
jgi:fibronectin type 3 domain-containing protein